MTIFGEEITRRRVAKGLTQDAAAHKMGMAVRSLRRLEKGETCTPRPQHARALKLVLDFTEAELRKFMSSSVYSIRNSDFVDERYAGDYVRLAQKLLDIDFETIDGLTEEFSGIALDRSEIFEKHTDTWRLLVYDNEIVGYWQLYCLQPTFFDRMRKGLMADGDINNSMIEPIVFRGHYKAYFNIIATKEGIHRRAEPVIILLESIIDTIGELSKIGIYFSDICADAFTHEGRRVCEIIGMNEEIKNNNAPNNVNASIFYMNGRDINKGYIGRYKSLCAEYQDEFR